MAKINFPRRLIQIIFGSILWLNIYPSHADTLPLLNPVVTSASVKAWVDQYVLPSYNALHQRNLQLQTQAHNLCANVSLAHLDDIKPPLNDALHAFAYSQAIDGGPMQDELRNFQLYFWPDRSNLVNRQLAQLMSQSDLLLLQQQGLEQASVALTGYPALERLLFVPHYRQKVIDDPQKFGCNYIIYITNNLVRITAAITKDWHANWRQQLVGFGDINSRFKTPADQVSFIFSNIDLLLSKIITKKLAKPLASSASKAKPKHLESWRSSNSLMMLKANTKALEDSLNITLKPALVSAGKKSKWHSISDRLTLIKQQLDQLPTPLVTHLSQPQYWQQTELLQAQFIQLQAELRYLYLSLNVKLGFNAYDGD